MTAWHRGPKVAFDTETTGQDPDWARIVTATIVEISPDGATRAHQWLLNPGVDIPQGATDVHGVTTERAQADGVDPGQAIFEITGLLALNLYRGVPVIAYNGAYDLTVLDRECRRHGVDTLTDRLAHVAPIVDPYVLDKAVDKYRPSKCDGNQRRAPRCTCGAQSRQLADVCLHYGVRIDGAHDATADALAAARVAFALAERYPELQVDVARLHTLQVTWRREQCESLEEYLRRTDPTATVNGDWPIQALPDAWAPGYHPATEPAVVS